MHIVVLVCTLEMFNNIYLIKNRLEKGLTW